VSLGDLVFILDPHGCALTVGDGLLSYTAKAERAHYRSILESMLVALAWLRPRPNRDG
jgi:hypothetical protein